MGLALIAAKVGPVRLIDNVPAPARSGARHIRRAAVVRQGFVPGSSAVPVTAAGTCPRADDHGGLVAVAAVAEG
jgi:hypothetical protein